MVTSAAAAVRSYTARLGLTVRRVGPPDTGSTHTGMPARVPMSHGPGWSEDNKVPRYSACTHARSPWEITESGVPRFSTRVASRITLRGAGVHALFIAQPDCGISPPEHTRRGRRVFSRDLRRRPGWRSRRISALLRVVEGCRGSAAPRASNSLHWMEPNAAPHRVSLVQHEPKRVTTRPRCAQTRRLADTQPLASAQRSSRSPSRAGFQCVDHLALTLRAQTTDA